MPSDPVYQATLGSLIATSVKEANIHIAQG
jgi:hypothetical protein